MTILDNDENLRSINSICSLLEISGENSLGFLNNLLISDLPELQHGKFHYTALCNPKGRIISSLWISIFSNDRIYLVCPKNMQETLIKFFTIRKFRLKISIKNCTDQITFDKKNIGIEITKQSCNQATLNEYYLFIFDLGLPWINKEFTEKFIPQHVNLDKKEDVMSFTKGCYPGQEIIARIKYLGKVKKRMEITTSKASKIDNINVNPVSPVIFNSANNSYQHQEVKKLEL